MGAWGGLEVADLGGGHLVDLMKHGRVAAAVATAVVAAAAHEPRVARSTSTMCWKETKKGCGEGARMLPSKPLGR
jgi:hypothetical protein